MKRARIIIPALLVNNILSEYIIAQLRLNLAEFSFYSAVIRILFRRFLILFTGLCPLRRLLLAVNMTA